MRFFKNFSRFFSVFIFLPFFSSFLPHLLCFALFVCVYLRLTIQQQHISSEICMKARERKQNRARQTMEKSNKKKGSTMSLKRYNMRIECSSRDADSEINERKSRCVPSGSNDAFSHANQFFNQKRNYAHNL